MPLSEPWAFQAAGFRHNRWLSCSRIRIQRHMHAEMPSPDPICLNQNPSAIITNDP